MQISDFIVVEEIDDPSLADGLFLRGYRKDAPKFPHHIIAWYVRDNGSRVPVSYVHFTDCNDIWLAGGAATDGDVLRSMKPEQQQALREYGGLMLATLRYGFEHYGPKCEAIFTCCGDARALETTPKLGFVETGVQYLLVNFRRDPSDRRKGELTAKAASFMPF
jgi:hypothetical protein